MAHVLWSIQYRAALNLKALRPPGQQLDPVDPTEPTGDTSRSIRRPATLATPTSVDTKLLAKAVDAHEHIATVYAQSLYTHSITNSYCLFRRMQLVSFRYAATSHRCVFAGYTAGPGTCLSA